MGNYTDGRGVPCFMPDDTETCFYIIVGTDLGDIMERAKRKFGEDITLDDIDITAEHIHTDAIGYDLHDPSDWTEFLKISDARA